MEEKIKTFKKEQHCQAREWAKKEKEKYNIYTSFDLRFKIDSGIQRRIQCALKVQDLYNACGENLNLCTNIFNIPNIESEKRKRNKIN